MKALNQPFTKIINGTCQFVIPVFQRDFTWMETQCSQLWNDILDIADDSKDRGHFIGSVVYVATGDSSAGFTRWLLIDGQQRVTTLTLLLTALRDYIDQTGWIDPHGDVTAKKIDAYHLRNIHEEGDKTQKLVLRRRDQATLSALVNRKDLPEDVSERISDAYDFFYDRLADVDPAKVYQGFGRLVIVDVTLDREQDDPQLIFESLNSTGVDLSQSDLIRNYILMGLPEKEQTHLYEQHWSKIEGFFLGSEKLFDSFARDFLALHTKANKQEKADNIYRSFRAYFKKLIDEYGNLTETMKEIQRYASYYAAFTLGRSTKGSLAESLTHVRQLGEAPAILVMQLFHCFDRAKTLSETEFVQALELVESYLFRRAICGEQTRNYWQVFSALTYSIQVNDPLASLKVGLAAQRETTRFPTDKDFRRELLERELYGMRVCHHLLVRLENYGTKERSDTSSYSIEHIMPQNERLRAEWRDMLGSNWKELQKTYVHRLGNLTLTGYNSTYSDRSFEEKKTTPGGFDDSAVRLNRYVREQEVWTENEIVSRGKALAKKCLTVWPQLMVDDQLVRAEKDRQLRERATQRNVSDVEMTDRVKDLFDKLRRELLKLDDRVIEVAERKSISYHGPEFFLEALPRKRRLTLLLAIDFNELEGATDIAQDTSERAFFVNAKYEGGVMIILRNAEDIEEAMKAVKQCFRLVCSPTT